MHNLARFRGVERVEFGRLITLNAAVKRLNSTHTQGQPTAPADPRRGAATLDYVLVLGIILPLAAIVLPTGKRIIQLVYEMICVWLAWPFM